MPRTLDAITARKWIICPACNDEDAKRFPKTQQEGAVAVCRSCFGHGVIRKTQFNQARIDQ